MHVLLHLMKKIFSKGLAQKVYFMILQRSFFLFNGSNRTFFLDVLSIEASNFTIMNCVCFRFYRFCSVFKYYRWVKKCFIFHSRLRIFRSCLHYSTEIISTFLLYQYHSRWTYQICKIKFTWSKTKLLI